MSRVTKSVTAKAKHKKILSSTKDIMELGVALQDCKTVKYKIFAICIQR